MVGALRHAWLKVPGAVPPTPGWGPLAVVVCGVWCVVCGGGVLVGLWLVFGVLKALLPKGKGRDVYPRVQVNGLGCVCCVRAVCKCVMA